MKNHNISLSKCKKRESSRLTWSCLQRERGGGRTKHSAVRNSSSNYCLATQGACKEERATVWEENRRERAELKETGPGDGLGGRVQGQDQSLYTQYAGRVSLHGECL